MNYKLYLLAICLLATSHLSCSSQNPLLPLYRTPKAPEEETSCCLVTGKAIQAIITDLSYKGPTYSNNSDVVQRKKDICPCIMTCCIFSAAVSIGLGIPYKLKIS